MARQEEDREDLLAEAVALVERIELRLTDAPDPVVIGFRRDGCPSFYLGPDEAYHFNTAGELRRAYVEGRLIKAERGALAALTRQRAAGQVQLLRHDLTAEETAQFLQTMTARLQSLRQVLEAGAMEIVGRVPDHADVLARARQWLSQLDEPLRIARSPRVG